MNKIKDLTHDRLDADRRASYAHEIPLDATTKGRWERSWPTIACGAGLFSDGYLNGVCTSNYPK
jgi:hypothetical protein